MYYLKKGEKNKTCLIYKNYNYNKLIINELDKK